MIISLKFSQDQQDKLLSVLRECKNSIEWTITNLKGISPLVHMHKIILKYGAKPIRDAQRILNPIMMDVVKNEVLKWLEAGLI